jgi:hypothetical protein
MNFKAISIGLMVGLGLIVGTAAAADYSDNFDGGLQEPWIFGNFDGLGMPSATATASVVNDQLVFTDPLTAAVGGAASVFGIHPDPFDDVRVTAVINPNANIDINDSQFVFARGNPTTNEFYSAEVDYDGSRLILWRSDGLAVGGEIAGVDIPNLQFDQSVYLEFEAVESDYTARLYEEPGGALLAEVSGFDDTRGPDPGLTGLITSSQSSTSLEILGVWDDVTATSLDVVAVDADFDDDGSVDCIDVDALVADIAAGNNTASFDLTGDGVVNRDDLDAWLVEAGNGNINAPYLPADGNLSGAIDVSDFNIWNANKFQSGAGFCGGDYNGDGSTDVSDFNIWNANKFQSSDSGAAAVPEPATSVLALFAGLALFGLRRRS